MAKINGGAVLGKALKKEGVEVVFSLCGDHTIEMNYGLVDQGIKIIDVRHEAVAVAAADGYACSSGKPGVVLLTAGPGVCNGVCSAYEAHNNRTPVILIGGGAPVKECDAGPLQDMKNIEIMNQFAKFSKRIYETRRVGEYVTMAFRHATTGLPGFSYLELPYDVMLNQVEEEELIIPAHSKTVYCGAGEEAAIEEAAELLANAERPAMLIGGHSVYSSDDNGAVAALSDYLLMPCHTIGRAAGQFMDESNPMTALGIPAFVGADVILMVNAEGNFLSMRNLMNPEAKVIQINVEPELIGWNIRADVGIVGGSGAVIKQLLKAVTSKRTKRIDKMHIMQTFANLPPMDESYKTDEATPIHPGKLAYEVGQFYEKELTDWNLSQDGGDSGAWFGSQVKAHRPGQHMNCGVNGTIGLGLPWSMGMYFGNKKPVLFYTGDGSFGYHTTDIETMLRHKIPVICVISNDNAWGMIKGMEYLANPEKYMKYENENKYGIACNLTPDIRYDKLAEVYGGYGEFIKEVSELKPALYRALEAAKEGKFSIINVSVRDITVPGAAGMGTLFLTDLFSVYQPTKA